MKAKQHLTFLLVLPLAVQAGEVAPDYSAKDAKDVLIPEPSPSQWSFGFGLAPIVGADTNFSGLGTWDSPFVPQDDKISTDRFYDDGFNRVDGTGNGGGLTSYWGYDNASQYDPSGNGSIAMSIFNSRSNGSVSEDDIGWGGELFATRAMGEVTFLSIPGATWGWRIGLHVNRFSSDNSSTLTTDVDVTTDTFSLGGAVPPTAPFSGSPTGFGNALLGDQPSRTTSVAQATITGDRDFDATLFGLSAGPYLDIPVNDRFSMRAQGGLSLALAHGDYEFNSLTTTAGGIQTTGGSESETSLLPGFHLGVGGVYDLNDDWALHAGIRYQYYKSFDISVAGSKAELDFSSAFLINVGASYRF